MKAKVKESCLYLVTCVWLSWGGAAGEDCAGWPLALSCLWRYIRAPLQRDLLLLGEVKGEFPFNGS